AHGATMSLGCIGNRVYTGIPDDHIYMMVRGADLEKVASGLDGIMNANAQLTAFHQMRRPRLTKGEAARAESGGLGSPNRKTSLFEAATSRERSMVIRLQPFECRSLEDDRKTRLGFSTSTGTLPRWAGPVLKSQTRRTSMRTRKDFVLGAIMGAGVVWLWGRQMEEYVKEKTRGVRTKAAEGVRTVEETTGKVLDRGGEALRRADEFLQDTKGQVSEALQAGQEAIRPAPAARRA